MRIPKAKECRCWQDYPNQMREERCEYYECIKPRKGFYAGNGTKTICRLKEQKYGTKLS